jgi:dTMP kinase
MVSRGKLIVLEGIDGSGKHTQIELLASALASRGLEFSQVGFPNYDGFFGKLVAQFLNGDFGPLEHVDPHFSALLYANDRLESKPHLEADLAAGRTLLADRYIASNMAHQGARVLPGHRPAFLKWLKQLEYEIYGLPAEDLVIYLRVPSPEAHRLIAQKGKRDYTKLERDLQEANIPHLEAASEVYDQLASQPNWIRIECLDAGTGKLRSPAAIHREILAAVETRVLRAHLVN